MNKNDELFPKYRLNQPNGSTFTLADFAEIVTEDTLPYFLSRVVNESKPGQEYRSLILKAAAETLKKDVNQLVSLLNEIQPQKPSNLEYCEILKMSIISDHKLINTVIEARPFVMKPWLKKGSLNLISAPRGIGKSWLAASMAEAITHNLNIGDWETENPVNCLLVDGEMSADDLQTRLKSLTAGLQTPEARLDILSAELMHQQGYPVLNLADLDRRNALLKFLKQSDYGLVVFDNISALTPGLDENSKQDWDPIAQFLLQVRFLGITVILLHHTGKDTTKGGRGTSGREDHMDCCIILSRPINYKQEDGCRFDMEFTKARGIQGNSVNPICFSLVNTDTGLWWETDIKKSFDKEAIIALLGNEIPQKDISAILKVDKSTVSKIKTKAIKDRFIEEIDRGKCRFTPKGKQTYGHIDVDKLLSRC